MANIFQYLLKITENRIEHNILPIFILIIIILIFVSTKLKIIIIFIISLIYFKTISNILKLLSIYCSRGYNQFSKSCKDLIYTMNVSENFSDLPLKNSIIVANYPSEMTDYAAFMLIPKKTKIVIAEHLVHLANKFGAETIPIKKNQPNYEYFKQNIKDNIKTQSIFSYINNYPHTRLHKQDLGQIRKGIFYIAHELKIPITPIAIDTVDHTLGIISKQRFQIKVGPTIMINDPRKDIKTIKKFFKSQMKYFALTKYSFNSVSRN
jgi:hypothetical protein